MKWCSDAKLCRDDKEVREVVLGRNVGVNQMLYGLS